MGRSRTRILVDGPRWTLILLLGFAGGTKVFSWGVGVSTMPVAGAGAVGQALVSTLANVSAVLEVALALALTLLAAPRRVLPFALAISGSWLLAMLALPLFGIQVAHCGCLGASLQVALLDHLALSLGAVLICASQARRIMTSPWMWYRPLPQARQVTASSPA